MSFFLRLTIKKNSSQKYFVLFKLGVKNVVNFCFVFAIVLLSKRKPFGNIPKAISILNPNV